MPTLGEAANKFDAWKLQSLATVERASRRFTEEVMTTNCGPFTKLAQLMHFYIELCKSTHDAGKNFLQEMHMTRADLEWVNQLLAGIFMDNRSVQELPISAPLTPEHTLAGSIEQMIRDMREIGESLRTTIHHLHSVPGFQTFRIHVLECAIVAAMTNTGRAAEAFTRLKMPGTDEPGALPPPDDQASDLVRDIFGGNTMLEASQAELAS